MISATDIRTSIRDKPPKRYGIGDFHRLTSLLDEDEEDGDGDGDAVFIVLIFLYSLSLSLSGIAVNWRDVEHEYIVRIGGILIYKSTL